MRTDIGTNLRTKTQGVENTTKYNLIPWQNHASMDLSNRDELGERRPQYMNEQEQSSLDIGHEIKRLRELSVHQLQDEYLQRFGLESRSCNKDFLWKRIAYRIQESREGGLSDKAKARAAYLGPSTQIRVKPPREFHKKAEAEATKPNRDPRLPEPGTVLHREYEGEVHNVVVLQDGFEFRGERYRSLSAIAKVITGTSWNGFLWFGLEKRSRKKGNGR